MSQVCELNGTGLSEREDGRAQWGEKEVRGRVGTETGGPETGMAGADNKGGRGRASKAGVRQGARDWTQGWQGEEEHGAHRRRGCHGRRC